MDIAFKEYLQDFLNRYDINPDGINFDSVSGCDSMQRQLEINNIDFSDIQFHLIKIFDLHKEGINIYESDYKESPQYSSVKNKRICGVISMENYIESCLLDVYDQESIYAMGNPHKLDKDEIEDETLDDEIMENMNLHATTLAEDDSDEIYEFNIADGMRDKESTFRRIIYRPGELIDKLKNQLDFDIKLFDEKKYKAEIFKIIYFFFALRHKLIPELRGKLRGKEKKFFEVIDFLFSPSMESIDYSFLGLEKVGLETYNGKIIQLIKNSLIKEMFLKERSRQALANINDAFHQIAPEWDNLIGYARIAVEQGFDFNQTIRVLKSILHNPYKSMDGNKYQASPIETLYLKVKQHEFIGLWKDILLVNKIKIKANYKVPKDLTRQMLQLPNQPIDFDEAESVININAKNIAKFVYPKKKKIKSNDIDKILYHKGKVPIILGCCMRAIPHIVIAKEFTLLHIISCLQVILTDDGNEIFDYAFHGSQDYIKHIRVQAALKSNKYIVEALKLYLARKANDHWYANTGRHRLRCKLREFENKRAEILIQIFSCSSVAEMLSTHQVYYEQLMEVFVSKFEQYK